MAVPASSAVWWASAKVSIMLLSVFSMLAEFAFVPSESFLISPATTAKPRPALPAWAASMAAFIASRFVRSLISLIAEITSLIASTFWLKTLITSRTRATLLAPSPVAVASSSVIWILFETTLAIFWTEEPNCSKTAPEVWISLFNRFREFSISVILVPTSLAELKTDSILLAKEPKFFFCSVKQNRTLDTDLILVRNKKDNFSDAE